jgi:hypothetical protein
VSERAGRIDLFQSPEPSRSTQGREPSSLPPHVAGVLALQRSAGNAAVNRLLRIPLDPPTVTSAPQAPTTARERFEAQLHSRWSVANVATGTEANQVEEMRRMTPDTQPAPTSVAGWQEWDPGPNSELYDDILDAFEIMALVVGGIPEVHDLRFLAVDYENVGGTAQARPRHGATYSAGLLDIFRRLETAGWPLPQGRSSAGAPAQIGTGSTSDSRRRIVVHELSHGVYERFGNPTLAGGSTQFFRDWEQAGGWVNGQLQQNGTPLSATNWNDDWPEQPVSAYSLTNAMEDFAESLMCFVESPTVLRDRSPARHRFIASRVGAWRSGLRQPSGSPRPLRPRGPRGDFILPSGDTRYA